MENKDLTSPALSRKETAAYLGICITTLDNSDIPRIRIGTRTLFRKSTLDELIAEREKSPKARKARKHRKSGEGETPEGKEG